MYTNHDVCSCTLQEKSTFSYYYTNYEETKTDVRNERHTREKSSTSTETLAPHVLNCYKQRSHAQWLTKLPKYKHNTFTGVSKQESTRTCILRTSIALSPPRPPEVLMASLRPELGARLTGLSLQDDPFLLSGDSKPESMDDSEPLELSPRASGSSMCEA